MTIQQASKVRERLRELNSGDTDSDQYMIDFERPQIVNVKPKPKPQPVHAFVAGHKPVNGAEKSVTPSKAPKQESQIPPVDSGTDRNGQMTLGF